MEKIYEYTFDDTNTSIIERAEILLIRSNHGWELVAVVGTEETHTFYWRRII